MSTRLPLVFAITLCACSGTVEVDPPTTGTGGSGGDTAPQTGGTGGGTGGVGASGGGILTGGGGSGGSTQTTGGAGGALPCDGAGVIDVDIDGDGEGPTMPLTWACTNDPPAPGAYGAIGYAGKGGPPMLLLVGCNAPGELGAPAGLTLWGEQTSVGTTQAGQANFSMFGKQYPPTDTITLTVSGLGEVGEIISGDLAFTVVNADGTGNSYTAKFNVCRYPDLPPPP